MPLLNIRPSQVDIQLSRALGGMSQDLLEDGGGATGIYFYRIKAGDFVDSKKMVILK